MGTIERISTCHRTSDIVILRDSNAKIIESESSAYTSYGKNILRKMIEDEKYDRYYKGHRYRIMTKFDKYGNTIYFPVILKKSWFGFGKGVWKPIYYWSGEPSSKCMIYKLDEKSALSKIEAFIDEKILEKETKEKLKNNEEKFVEIK